jgi:hypothetical protein
MELVFIHLGDRLPNYLIENLKVTKKLFPDKSITLIVSNNNLNQVNITGVDHMYVYNLEASELNNLTGFIFDQSSQPDFWRYSLERFLAFSSWHDTKPEVAALHIESDVLLMPDFNFDVISAIPKLRWANVNSNHDIASILYSPGPDETNWLSTQICKELTTDSDLTDMTALFRVRNKNDEHVIRLKTIPSIETNETKKSEDRIIYDGARIGMWLCGENAFNHFGFIVKHINHSDSEVKPSFYDYKINKNGGITLTNNGVEWKLQNLHIHSKNLKIFAEVPNQDLIRDLQRATQKRKILQVTPLLTAKILISKIKNQLWKLIDA